MKGISLKENASFYFLQFGKFDVIYFFRKNKKRLLADFCPILHELYPLFY
mgnify:CR=1 FL=1